MMLARTHIKVVRVQNMVGTSARAPIRRVSIGCSSPVTCKSTLASIGLYSLPFKHTAKRNIKDDL